jgi:hypothetical protein
LFPPPPGVLTIAKWSVLYTAFMFARPFLDVLGPLIVQLVPAALGSTPAWLPMAMSMAASPITVIVAIALPAVLALISIDNETAHRFQPLARRCLVWIPPALVVIVVACMAPAAYGTSSPPPPRALIIPGFFMMCAAMAWGTAMGVRLCAASMSQSSARAACAVVAVLTLWSAGAAAQSAWRRGADVRAWAARWDATHEQLRTAQAAGNIKPLVPVVGSIAGVGSIAADPNDWVNVCAARYYDVESISGTGAR